MKFFVSDGSGAPCTRRSFTRSAAGSSSATRPPGTTSWSRRRDGAATVPLGSRVARDRTSRRPDHRRGHLRNEAARGSRPRLRRARPDPRHDERLHRSGLEQDGCCLPASPCAAGEEPLRHAAHPQRERAHRPAHHPRLGLAVTRSRSTRRTPPAAGCHAPTNGAAESCPRCCATTSASSATPTAPASRLPAHGRAVGCSTSSTPRSRRRGGCRARLEWPADGRGRAHRGLGGSPERVRSRDRHGAQLA